MSDVESQEFKDEIAKRAFVKNMAFAIESVPMFQTLQEISIATTLNSKAQIPITLEFPCLLLSHCIWLIGVPRTIVKCAKVIVGIPFCFTSEIVEKASTQVLKTFNLPNTTLDMQGTIGVPSDLKLQDVLEDMKRWNENNAEELEALKQLYKLQRKKK